MTPDALLAADLEAAAEALREARARRRPIPPLTDAAPGLLVEDAYAIAASNVARRLAHGAHVVGHKIGLTSPAVQAQLGVDEPDYGALLDEMELADGATIERGDFIVPRVELELAFHLADRLAGPGVTAEDVRGATACVQPAIELVDSRIADWRIRLADTVADAASSAAFVLGGRRVPIADFDPAAVEVALYNGDELLERGRSDAVLGDPCAAVAWLANTLGPFGDALEPGHVVLSGACTRMVAAQAGDRFRGDFGALGTVSLDVALPR